MSDSYTILFAERIGGAQYGNLQLFISLKN